MALNRRAQASNEPLNSLMIRVLDADVCTTTPKEQSQNSGSSAIIADWNGDADPPVN